MIKTKVFFSVVILILGFSLSAYSQDNGAKADASYSFQDTASLTAYMKSQGMDPLNIDWVPINLICSGLNNGPDEVPYNKCKYEQARNSFLHKADRSQCSIRAKASYPDSLKNGRLDTLSETDKNGQIHTFERRSAPVSDLELEQLRMGAIVECMQGLGWVDADNWRLGRHNICP